MNGTVKELFDYRELLLAFTKRNIKIKYKQTMMGFLWAIFTPIVIVLAGVMVKFAMAKISGKPLEYQQIASVMVKALPWGFFIQGVKFSVGSLVANMNIVKKIYFPRAIFPLSYILGQLFDLTVAGVAFTIFLSFARVGGSIYLLWLPLIIVLLILLTAGLGMILSSANLFYRDVRYIVDVMLTFGIFFTPVYFDASMFGSPWQELLLLNPMGAILENLNNIIVLHQPPMFGWLLYAAVWSIGGFLIAWRVFHKFESSFAENI